MPNTPLLQVLSPPLLPFPGEPCCCFPSETCTLWSLSPASWSSLSSAELKTREKRWGGGEGKMNSLWEFQMDLFHLKSPVHSCHFPIPWQLSTFSAEGVGNPQTMLTAVGLSQGMPKAAAWEGSELVHFTGWFFLDLCRNTVNVSLCQRQKMLPHYVEAAAGTNESLLSPGTWHTIPFPFLAWRWWIPHCFWKGCSETLQTSLYRGPAGKRKKQEMLRASLV